MLTAKIEAQQKARKEFAANTRRRLELVAELETLEAEALRMVDSVRGRWPVPMHVGYPDGVLWLAGINEGLAPFIQEVDFYQVNGNPEYGKWRQLRRKAEAWLKKFAV